MTDQKHSTTLQRIPFHDDELYAIIDERTGIEYVLPKPMADIFGLRWHGQLAKLNKSKLFRRGIQKMCIPTLSGEQEAVLLERRLVHAWLLSIDVARIQPAMQEKLLRYQEECAQVLDDYFAKGRVENPRSALDHHPDLKAITALAMGLAEARDLATQARAEAQEAKTASAAASTKADLAIANQQWVTIREYVYLNTLHHQMPRAACIAYGTYLTGYCVEHGIPVRDQGVADRQWGTEHAYHVEAIAATLWNWLKRREGQSSLGVVRKGDPERCEEEAMPYRARRHTR